MPALIATKELRYGDRTVHPGEPFDASEKDARLLKAIGKAKDGEPVNKTDLPKATMPSPADPELGDDKEQEPPAPLERGASYQTRHMEADTGLTGEEKPSPSSRRGRPQKGRKSERSED